MGRTLVALLPVVSLCPEGVGNRECGPLYECLSHKLWATQTPMHPALVTTALGDRRDAENSFASDWRFGSARVVRRRRRAAAGRTRVQRQAIQRIVRNRARSDKALQFRHQSDRPTAAIPAIAAQGC